VWDALYRQTGIIKVECEDDMLDYLQAFYYLPLPRGNRVAIVSATGGVGVGIADACIQNGLEVATLSDKTRRRIQEFVPSVGTCLDNPIDLGMMSSFNIQTSIETVKALAQDNDVDMIIKTIGTADLDMISREFEALKGFDKPVIYIFSRALKVRVEVPNPVKGVGVYSTGRRAAQVLSKLIQYQRYRSG
jgi:acetyltransferase